ncbi:hypothetical protein L7F22_038079 [Adiantum nelumboides]|nr:hypothetical protein [Adiantum nelumboides]
MGPEIAAISENSIATHRTSKRFQKQRLSKAESANYARTTNFSRSEILRLHSKFQSMTRGKDELTFKDISNIEEMKANPFAHRIFELFSEDGSGHLTFDKFLNMMDAFSDDTPSEVKLVWAFAMWDYDGDGVIGAGDIKHGVDLMTHSGPMVQPSMHMLHRVASNAALDSEELDLIVKHVCQEVDPNCNGLSYFDFRRILARMPDFLHNFHISI